MVQILNKMVQILNKVEESVPKISSSIALHKSFSQVKYCTQFCLFVLANQMQASRTQIFSYLWHLLLLINALFKAQIWQKAEEYVSKQVCQHSSAQVIATGKIRRVLHVNFECLFWPIKCMHSKPRFWVHFSHVFYFLNAFSKALSCHKAEEYVLKQFGGIALHVHCAQIAVSVKENRVFYQLEFSI